MKKSLFFCENCGSKVQLKDEICPECKFSFSAVRCPKCHFKGSNSLFKNGCPKCFYLTKDQLEAKKTKVKLFPLWFYKVAISILLIFIVFLLIFFY